MSANASRRETQTPVDAERAPVQHPSEDHVWQPAGDAALSPALQLQNMLGERLGVIEASALKHDKYDIRIRLACILGISAAGWGILFLAARGVIALLTA